MAPPKPKTWLLLVNHKFQAIGECFLVNISGRDLIANLTKKVKKERRNALANVDAADLTVWKSAIIIDETTTSERLAEILRNIKVDEKDTIEKIGSYVQVANLGLSDGQTLLVQLPAVMLNGDDPLGDPITSNLDLAYKEIFLYAHTKGKFTAEDFDLNNVIMDDNSNVPEFVQKHEEMLGRKRKVPDNLRASETNMGQASFKEYFDCSTENSSQSFPIVDRLEVNHAITLSSVGTKLWNTSNDGNRKLFKECDANWLLFYSIACHFESLPSNIASDGTTKITVKLGQESWPFMVIVKVDGKYHTYKPRSDFLVLKFGLPRVAVEVNSNSPDRPAVDHHRVILLGASIVRFANTFLDAYKKKRNFVFLAIFIGDTGLVDRYVLYQKEGSQDVYRRKQAFDLSNVVGRLRFALELYNLSSALNEESENEDTAREVKNLAASVTKVSKEHMLPTFTGKTERPTNNDGGNRTGANVSRKGEDGGAIEQLESCGYNVVPDVLETDGGTWELISKLPPHILTVYRRGDPNRTELIAKHVREGSNELDILKYLHTIRSQSPHVISLIESIPSITTEWLILPKLHSIGDQRLMNCGGVRSRVELGWGLIKGLAYLHEHKVAHRDVKPHNLVCDGDFQLQIIDFDVAIEVQDENMEIDEYRGTKNWTAPEMGKEEGPTQMYSPIKADRWSCGRVLLCHMMVGKGDKRLSKFAEQLMANDPQQRPSLLEWRKWLAPFFNVANVLKDGGKESRPWQDMIEVDGEGMKPPDAKKPRIAVTQRGVRPELLDR